MLKILWFAIFIVPTTFARAETCALDFNTVSDLHVHQRVALENGRRGGFAIRVFSKTIEGVVRTIAVAGRGPRETEDHAMAGRALNAAFPEVGFTHETDKLGRKIQLPPRSLAARQAARLSDLISKNVAQLRQRMKTEKIKLGTMIAWVQSDDFKPIADGTTFGVFGDATEVKKAIVQGLRSPVTAPLTPAEQLVFDLEEGYSTPFRLRLHRAIFAEARRMAFFTHRVFTYIAGGLIGAGAATAWGVDPHLAWISAAGAAVLGTQFGVAIALDRPPHAGAELRARNARVARQLDEFLSYDRDISEMLIFTEQNRIHGLSGALDRAGYAEVRTTNTP